MAPPSRDIANRRKLPGDETNQQLRGAARFRTVGGKFRHRRPENPPQRRRRGRHPNHLRRPIRVKNGQTEKIGPSDGCPGNAVPLPAKSEYEFRKLGAYLGKVGLRAMIPICDGRSYGNGRKDRFGGFVSHAE